MSNEFYNTFDLERFPDTPTSEGDYRNAFQIERDRIIFSYPFRRLQSKTQVFQSGEYDFYRTRLTHSIEVAKIGRSICEYLKATSSELSNTYYIDPDLTEAICLAHDLGHPPFGHIGERKLNHLMQRQGGFEGNAQTLRILTELIYERPEMTKGIAPTRALLDGVMKYKATVDDWYQASGEHPEHHFIYDEQDHFRAIIFDQTELPKELQTPEQLNGFKSIECQIMDWADDTAYSLHDIVDGIHARYITVGSLKEWADSQQLDTQQKQLVETLNQVIRENRYEPYFGSRIGRFVHGCKLEKRQGFLSDKTNRHRLNLKISPEVKAESKLYKKIALDLIFRSPQLQQIEFKGGQILSSFFNAISDHALSSSGLRILPATVQELLDNESSEAGRYRRLCDYTAGLTDAQAVRTYKRLFNPDFGSIAELS